MIGNTGFLINAIVFTIPQNGIPHSRSRVMLSIIYFAVVIFDRSVYSRK